MISVFFFVFIIMRSTLIHSYEQKFANDFHVLLDGLIKNLQGKPEDELQEITRFFAVEHHANVTISQQLTDGTYQEIYTSSSYVWNKEMRTIKQAVMLLGKDKEMLMIEAETTIEPLQQLIETMNRMSPGIYIAMIVTSLVTAWLYSYHISKPIVHIADVAEQISHLHFSKYCVVNRSDEIGDLAKNLNVMSQKLETTLQGLQHEREREREAEKKRVDMFTAISHDLKTPLMVLKGELEGMIKKIGDYQDRDRFLLHAYHTTENLEQLIYKILTISQMEMNAISLSLQRENITNLIQELCQNYEDIANEKGINLVWYCDENLYALVDKLQLHHAISNIISNAIFYSPSGEITNIQLLQRGLMGVLTVENTGVHISEVEREKLFEAFYRTEKSRNKYTGGSGLGLFIVKKILELHDVQYKIENSEEGVIFTIEVPLVK